MPKRNDIDKILIIGAGPIIIGQACEFDYAGTQACKALKEEGYKVILVNSNPATIMTDPETTDITYIEPVTPNIIEKIIEKEKPDALLPTMGGQTALNTALTLEKKGILKKFNVELIGANKKAIDRAEDRELFRECMINIGLECPKSLLAHSLKDARKALKEIGIPLVIRPSYTLGGTGGGIANNKKEFESIVSRGLDASPTQEVLIEESVAGWKEYEMEVVRDKSDNCIIVCSIENIDPMGTHTGDSITVAPALTLTDKEYQLMRNASIAVLRKIGVETGGSNVQFAINPKNGKMVVIEMNPRVSRSSALASKATGFPIAKIATKLAVGFTLDELANDITKTTPASFEPTIDYIVTKIPRFAFEKFPGTKPLLTTSMKSVGEVMAIGRTFPESLQKALRSMETGFEGLDKIKNNFSREKNFKLLKENSPDKIFRIAEALRSGVSIQKIQQATKYDKWFIEQLKIITDTERNLKNKKVPLNRERMIRIKSLGFSDKKIAEIRRTKEKMIKKLREKFKVNPVFKRVDTCASEFPSTTPYMYSTYEENIFSRTEGCESRPSQKKKVIILGSGPNRIGQGIEFDYCCVHASYALKEIGVESIMINCNPETVSTDYDTSDRLYFEPLTEENVLEIVKKEKSKGIFLGIIVQFGGQTPLKLCKALKESKIPILGTSPDAIDLAEDRKRFKELLVKIKLKQPRNGIAKNKKEAITIAKEIGFPIVIRPSYVLGGRAMEIVYQEKLLKSYIDEAMQVSGNSPVLIDRYLKDAIEIDVDALSDGKNVYIAGIMEHIEKAGIHSGDSACSLPPRSISNTQIKEIKNQTVTLAKALNVIGLMNIQFAIQDEIIYILEVNPRASRTVPFVSKATGIPIARLATRIIMEEKINFKKLKFSMPKHISIKESVFPFNRFPGVDLILGPEMKSTGEVMGIDKNFSVAFAKAQISSGTNLPISGTVFISVKDEDKESITRSCKKLVNIGFRLFATKGTAKYLKRKGIQVRAVKKVYEGSPNVVDALKKNKIQLVINTTTGAKSIADSFSLRRTTLKKNIPYYTTVAGAIAAVDAIEAIKKGDLKIKSLQSHIASIV